MEFSIFIYKNISRNIFNLLKDIHYKTEDYLKFIKY